MTRKQYTNTDLGRFSEWHRETLCDWHRWIDIDYLGYQVENGEYTPYIAIERIRLTNCDPQKAPHRYPIDSHKKGVYQSLSESLDIPAYVMWHTDDCDSFLLERLDKPEERRMIFDANGLMNFLDEHRDNKVQPRRVL